MSETVIRHRGQQRDKYGQYTGGAPHTTLTALLVAPGGGSEFIERSRGGEKTECTVYFETGTDIINSDELTVRGERYSIVVNDWRKDDFGGVEVLCNRGQG